ncbi:hypothetical protein DLD77_10270 [Chitinophaga alhagiae]|uniref:VIT domain-containing protein n=1 Tax=Chitinophaga alhagiae TaxID=2203219 RepID=A0ABM6WD89_9BACT|nr:VIT domain-containing protein [Chitinophaga alhagiae]AWO02052.1 hypothetical protein DLD77_10270 [Chitinophaga alhagiae]
MISALRLAVLMLLATVPAMAQMPVLKVKEPASANAVTLQSLKVDVQVTGNIATTVMTMQFRNNGSKVLEGELSFPLPEGVTVSRYALDINGHMREAVPVEKRKATETFESIEQRRVDPGLLEKTEGNNFRTRIYPFLPNRTRTILIGYEEELKGQRYHLPLDYRQAIPSFSLKATVWETLTKPELEEQPDGSFTFRGNGNTYIAEINKSNYQPDKPLTIHLPKSTSMPEVLLQKAGSSHYFLVNAYPKAQSRPRALGNRIGLIWDVSLSGLKRDRAKEMELLGKLINEKQQLTIELLLLNNRLTKAGSFTITRGNWKALEKVLQNLVYDGGTSFAALRPAAVDEYLFFTDGLSTFSAPDIRLQKPVHCITTAPRADYSQLKWIAAQTGGQFINLQTLSVKEAARQLEQEVLHFIGIKKNDAVREVYPSLPTPVNGAVAVAGITDNGSASITLQYGYRPGAVEMEQTVQLKPGTATMVNVHRIWAQKKIAEMDIRYEEHKEEIGLLSRQFGIVTRNTSLLVLETAWDYVHYGIPPPPDLQQECDRIAKQQRAQQATHVNNLLDKAVAKTAELKKWWNEVFKPKKHFPQPDSTGIAGNIPRPATRMTSERSANAMRRSAPMRESEIKDRAVSSPVPVTWAEAPKAEEQVMVRGVAARDVTASRARPVQKVSIETARFKSDKAYMKGLEGASAATAYQHYLQQRKEYAATPLFYFDIASWFYNAHKKDTALTILSSIAELDQENAELYKLMAYKLKENKQYEQEIFVTRKILEWRPMDPQSYRDYALALEDGCFYQQALDTLYSTLLQSYTREAAFRDDGIEEIIITEINHLISLHKHRLNTSRIDKRLVAAMPVDVRVVINWNKKNTDIDLWVTDPNGEKCFYSHPGTSAGGRISNDFTDGYGPEQFLLKKAVKGKYTIAVNFFGESQVTITGPTTVMAEIYTRYATGQENREVICMQMPAAGKEGVFIGAFSF